MVSSCRGRHRTSLFSRKIHRYFFLSVYFDRFHRANANRCWLISKKSSDYTRVVISLFIYLFTFFSRFPIAYLFKTILSGLRSIVIAHRWILDEYCNTFPPPAKKISRRGTNFDFKYEVNKLFRSSSGKNYNCILSFCSEHK